MGVLFQFALPREHQESFTSFLAGCPHSTSRDSEKPCLHACTHACFKGPLNYNRALRISQSVTGINRDLSIATGIKRDLSIVIGTFAHSCLAGSSRHSTSRDSEKACLDACTHTCFRGLSLPFCGWNEISLKDI